MHDTNKHINDFGSVAVLMGGYAAEREISLKSGQAVFNALKRKGIDVQAIDVKDNIINAVQGLEIDRVFNIIHGRGGEDGILQAILDSCEIPYTGSGVLASALAMDKLRTKLAWRGAGLKTPDWHLIRTENDLDDCEKTLKFPVIVKPSKEGSSLGMSKANNCSELEQAWLKAKSYQCDVYAESWVAGKEYTIAVLVGEALPIIELKTENEFYDYDAKYQSEQTQYICPCDLSQEMDIHLKELAVKACEVIGVSGWGRVDLFIDHQNTVQLIEVNTVPGMTDHSLVPMAAKQHGLEFDELVVRILETSFDSGSNYACASYENKNESSISTAGRNADHSVQLSAADIGTNC